MGEGWETRRRRDAGHDFVVFRLGFVGFARQLIVDTAHFRYNATAEIMVYGCEGKDPPGIDAAAWIPMLGRTRLQPDTYHVFPLPHDVAVGSIRLDAFPDGGISRVRVMGRVEQAARRLAGYGWFNSLPPDQAVACLVAAGLPADVADHLAGLRPLRETWLADQRGENKASAVQGLTQSQLGQLTRLLEGAHLSNGTSRQSRRD